MRSVRALILGFALLSGCKPEPFRPDAGPPYWKPRPGEYGNWDVQLAANPDISAARAMYVLDLWEVVPADTMLDYGDGAPVTVPAGSRPGAIADLHTRATPAIAVCQVGTGAIRLDDPDASKFPGYAGGAPPNRPTLPASDSVIGWSRTTTDDKERFIDLRAGAQRATVASLIGKRIELAKTIGCDAIAARHNDMIAYEGQQGHGFVKVEYTEYVSWMTELATRAHEGSPISIGQGDGTTLTIDDTARMFDFLIEERCGERLDCEKTRPLRARSKAVFDIEYKLDEIGMPYDRMAICGQLSQVGDIEGIIKDAPLSSAPAETCP